MRIDGTFDFTAPPEVVFNSLVDPERTHRWLPSGARLEWLEGRRVRVTAGSTGATLDLDVDSDRLAIGWRPRDGGGFDGRVRVEDGPAGGSRLHAAVGLPAHGVDEARARALLAEAMRHLQRDVSDNFNAG